MGLLTTLVFATMYVILLGYLTPTSTIATPNIRTFQGRKLEFSGDMATIPASGTPDDDIVMTSNRRQSRIVDEFKYEGNGYQNSLNSENTRPMESISTPQKERIVYVERRPMDRDVDLHDDRLNSFSSVRRPESHPDGDILNGRRERPYDDPVGLRAQREEIQARNNNEGGAFFSNWFGRSASNRPRTSEDYLLPSEPSRYVDNMPFLPPRSEKTQSSSASDVVGSILRALLN